jgi:hypothetical protein
MKFVHMKGFHIALMIFGSFGLWQGSVMLSQAIERQAKYQRAREIADRAGKPLLVVGGPLGGNPFRGIIRIPSYPCGDYCLDIDPGSCEGCSNIVVADVRDIPFPDRFFGAVLCSHVVEHMPTIDHAIKAIEELYRVADKVLVASPRKASILAWLIPDHFLWVRQDESGIWIEGREEKRIVLVRDNDGVLGESLISC